MFWLITMLATLGLGGASLFATLNRLGANIEKLFKDAPELTPATFAEGAYGKITGVVSIKGEPPVAPGIGAACVLYELVVYVAVSENRSTDGWRVAHRDLVGGEVFVTVGDTVVRVNARDVFLVRAPSHDSNTDLRPNPRAYIASSRVRYVPLGATVQVVGTLTREVDTDPAATQDYREVATNYRMIGKRKQPIVMATQGN